MSPALKSALARAPCVVFLCSANAIRSAFADIYAHHQSCPIPVHSAATTYDHIPLHPWTVSALSERGIAGDVVDRFAATAARDCRVPNDALVLGMTSDHLAAWRAAHPGRGALFRLNELVGVERDIRDPLLDDAPRDEVYATIERCVDELLIGLAARA